jgi:hypothetical protein
VLSFNPKFNKSERSNNWNSSINATRNDSNFKPNVNSVAKRPIANEFCKPMPETTIADRDLPPMSNQKGTVKEKRAYN